MIYICDAIVRLSIHWYLNNNKVVYKKYDSKLFSIKFGGIHVPGVVIGFICIHRKGIFYMNLMRLFIAHNVPAFMYKNVTLRYAIFRISRFISMLHVQNKIIEVC